VPQKVDQARIKTGRLGMVHDLLILSCLDRSRAVELLVILSVIALWFFEYGTELVDFGINWFRPAIHALRGLGD
jgi:hypothetical protein